MDKLIWITIGVLTLFFSKIANSQNLQYIETKTQIDSLLHDNAKKAGRFSMNSPKTRQTPTFARFYNYRNKMMDSLHLDSVYHIQNSSYLPEGLLLNGYNYVNASSMFCYFNSEKSLSFERLETHDNISYQMNFAKPIKVHGKKGILLFNLLYLYQYHPGINDPIPTQTINQRFLIFKYGGLVEYNKHPGRNSYDTIHLTYGGINNENYYFITINKDRNMEFRGASIKEGDSTLHARLSTKEYNTIIKILNYINIQTNTKLDAGYTDSNWKITTLHFSNGKNIEIYDRGMLKSFGLRRFYDSIDKIKSKYFTLK